MDKKIKRIEVSEDDDITFFFEDSSEPFNMLEFKAGSITRNFLERIEYEIQDYNSEVDLMKHADAD